MEQRNKINKKQKDLEYLLQGIDLNAIELKIEIGRGSRKVEILFWFICILFLFGFISIIALSLYQYKYI